MYTQVIDEIKEYRQNHPSASLEDYVAHLEEADNAMKELIQTRKDWYRGLVGRYFNLREWYFKVFEEDGELFMDSYEVYFSDDDAKTVMVTRCNYSALIEDWFYSPFDIPREDYASIAKEITEETFNKVVNKYNEICENVSEFLTTL